MGGVSPSPSGPCTVSGTKHILNKCSWVKEKKKVGWNQHLLWPQNMAGIAFWFSCMECHRMVILTEGRGKACGRYIVIPYAQMKEPQIREGRWLAQSHTASQHCIAVWGPAVLTQRPEFASGSSLVCYKTLSIPGTPVNWDAYHFGLGGWKSFPE